LLENLTDSALKKLPKVTGGDILFSNDTSKTLINAVNISKSSKDEFVATQHLLMSIFLSEGNIGKILKDQGITKKKNRGFPCRITKGRKNNFCICRGSIQCLGQIRQKS
jgi:ATP-dependent Clp protease ATP-binding subunit ClpB